jgi:hypothetical protein
MLSFRTNDLCFTLLYRLLEVGFGGYTSVFGVLIGFYIESGLILLL